MNSINIEIERTKMKLFKERVQNEMDTLKHDDPRYTKLDDIMKIITTHDSNLDDVLATALHDVYGKKWNRLPNYHKIQKIKEFLEEKYHSDIEKKNTLEKRLINLVDDGKLSSCKSVEYDNENMKINKIIISKTEILK